MSVTVSIAQSRGIVTRAQPLRGFATSFRFSRSRFDPDNARAIDKMQFVTAVDAMQYALLSAMSRENNGLHAVTIATMASWN